MDFDLEMELEDAGIDAFDFSMMTEGERREALTDACLDPSDFENIEFDSNFEAWSDLQDAGLSLDVLRNMDEDERREALSQAALDPDDYESVPDKTPTAPFPLKANALHEKNNPEQKIYRYCQVRFSATSQFYYYRADGVDLCPGDYVAVPVGHENTPTVLEVVGVGDYAEDAVPYPLEKTKRVLRKIEPRPEPEAKVNTKEEIAQETKPEMTQKQEQLYTTQEPVPGESDPAPPVTQIDPLSTMPAGSWRLKKAHIPGWAWVFLCVAILVGMVFAGWYSYYRYGIYHMLHGNYEKANAVFHTIENYRDSEKLGCYCRIAEVYDGAEEYLGIEYDLPEISLEYDKKYQSEIDQLRDRIRKLEENKYQEGLSLLDQGEYDKALALLLVCRDYKDANALAQYCRSAKAYQNADDYMGATYDLDLLTIQYEDQFRTRFIDLKLRIIHLHNAYDARLKQEEEQRQREREERIKKGLPYVGMNKSWIDKTSLGKHYDTTDESYWKDGKAHWYTNYYWKENGHTLFIATVSDDRGVVTEVTNYLDSEYLKRAREQDKYRSTIGFDDDDYDVDDYEDPEDFWYDHADEFDSYEDALDYWEENY